VEDTGEQSIGEMKGVNQWQKTRTEKKNPQSYVNTQQIKKPEASRADYGESDDRRGFGVGLVEALMTQ
jgi:hypothetical protein